MSVTTAPKILLPGSVCVNNLRGKRETFFLRHFGSQAGDVLKARMSRCVRCEHRASWQTICRFRKTAGGRFGAADGRFVGGGRSVRAADGRFGRSEPANCLYSALCSHRARAPAHPCFQCVTRVWTKNASEKCFTIAPKIVDAQASR